MNQEELNLCEIELMKDRMAHQEFALKATINALNAWSKELVIQVTHLKEEQKKTLTTTLKPAKNGLVAYLAELVKKK